MPILEKEKMNEYLHQYYVEHYGVRETDVWLDPPAVNVRVFQRDGQYISLKCHILTGDVTAYVE